MNLTLAIMVADVVEWEPDDSLMIQPFAEQLYIQPKHNPTLDNYIISSHW